MIFNETSMIDKLPRKYSLYPFKSGYILFLPDLPSWIYLSNIGLALYNLLKQGYTFGEAVEMTTGEDKNESYIIELNYLIATIFENRFFDENESPVLQNKIPNLTLSLTKECNLRCIHCYENASHALPNLLDYEDWINVVDSYSKEWTEGTILITGGEPLIYKHLYSLIKYIKNNYKHEVTLFTNGTLVNSQWIEIFDEYIDLVQISLDGFDLEHNDLIRGQGTYKQILNGIKQFLVSSKNSRLRISVSVTTTNINHLADKLVEFCLWLESYGQFQLILNPVNSVGRNSEGELSTSYADIEFKIGDEMEKLWEKGWDVNERFKPFEKHLRCQIGDNLIVCSDGKCRPCTFSPEIGDVRDSDLKDIYDRYQDEYDGINIELSETCNTCDFRYICVSGCGLSNLQLTGVFNNSICNEKYKKQLLSEIARPHRYKYLQFIKKMTK